MPKYPIGRFGDYCTAKFGAVEELTEPYACHSSRPEGESAAWPILNVLRVAGNSLESMMLDLGIGRMMAKQGKSTMLQDIAVEHLKPSSLLKNLEIESFRILAGRSVVVGAARVELDVIF